MSSKTPITSMMGMVDGMIYGVGEFKDRDKYLQKCREILEEQSELVQSILAISKLEMKTETEQEVFHSSRSWRKIRAPIEF